MTIRRNHETGRGCRRGRVAAVAGLLVAALVVAACSETQFLVHTAKRMGTTERGDIGTGRYKIGKPYQIKGVWYYPAEDFDYVETGIASWYGPKFNRRPTANGETFDMNRVSAAHRTLPLPSIVRVTNLDNGRSLIVRVNDRGPFAHGRIIDMSRKGAQLLGFIRQGTARVRVEIMADESRALAARMKGDKTIAEVGSPITVDKLPKAKVASESLPPPPGATPAVATSGPATATRLFVQAGAFNRFDNANKVRARLASLGRVSISQVLVDGRDFFRVRLGPLNDVAEADRFLERVLQSGYSGAKIVVE